MTEFERDANEANCSRRRFMLAATVGTAATATAGTTVAQADENDEENGAEETDENGNDENGDEENGEANGDNGDVAAGNVEPDYEGFLDDAPNYTQTEDLRGEDEVEVGVGTGPEGLEFEPPAIWIDPGTTVVWEWTGEGGSHNVVTNEGPADLSSELTDEAGFTYEHTFEEEGITTYYCEPHITVGMLGAVAVGDDIPTIEIDDDADEVAGVQLPDTARTIGVATGVAMMSTLGIAYVFMKYGGDYAGSSE